MKRPNQLMIESAVVGSLIIALTLGGTLGGLSTPSAWQSLPDPATIATQFNYTSIALQLNTTLTALAQQNFSGASYSLSQFSLLYYPSTLNSTVTDATVEISGINTAVPRALGSVELSEYEASNGQIINASTDLKLACSQVSDASLDYTEFNGTTSPELARLGVPVLLYSNASDSVHSLIDTLLNRCQLLSNQIQSFTTTSSSINFTIHSNQKSMETGGQVQIQGSLKNDTSQIANDDVSLYLNGTKFATTETDLNGSFSANSSTPFVYAPTAAIWAVASQNGTSDFQGAVSNTLYIGILFNETEIAIGDPPAVLPTFNFTVTGKLSTVSGTPLPGAPVQISSFGIKQIVNTNGNGSFSESLTVPQNASDGLYTIYAAFAPEGVLGPSLNYTTIQVVHEPLTIVLTPPSLLFSGFGKNISGTVTANGSALASSYVTVETLWGSFHSETDGRGQFNVNINVPISEFALSSKIDVSVIPAEPYVSRGSSAVAVSMLNPVELAIPFFIGGVVIYELNSLGIFKKRRSDDAQIFAEKATQEPFPQTILSDSKAAPELLGIYKSALLLASKKYEQRFLPSSTLREINSQIESVARGTGKSEFLTISFLLEDLLYAKSFDEERIEDARIALDILETKWGL